MKFEGYTTGLKVLTETLVAFAKRPQMDAVVGDFTIRVRVTAPSLINGSWWRKDPLAFTPQIRLSAHRNGQERRLDHTGPTVRAKYVAVEQAFEAWKRGERDMPTDAEFGEVSS